MQEGVNIRLTSKSYGSDHWYGIQAGEIIGLGKHHKRVKLLVKGTAETTEGFEVTAKRVYLPAPKSRLRRNPTLFTKVCIKII